MVLQQPRESIKSQIVASAKSRKDTPEQFVFLRQVNGITGMVQGWSVDVNRIPTNRGINEPQPHSNAKLAHLELVMHVPQEVGNYKRIGDQSLELIAEGDNETSKNGVPILPIEIGDETRKTPLHFWALGPRYFARFHHIGNQRDTGRIPDCIWRAHGAASLSGTVCDVNRYILLINKA